MIRIELDATINYPIEKVFDKLTDLPGYNTWMPKDGLFIRSKKNSEGPVGEGTTFTDKVRRGKAVGEIVEYKRPNRVKFRQTVYFLGMKMMESRPGYGLESINGNTKLHHVAEGHLYGIFKVLEPVIRIIAQKERERTVNALRISFE